MKVKRRVAKYALYSCVVLGVGVFGLSSCGGIHKNDYVDSVGKSRPVYKQPSPELLKSVLLEANRDRFAEYEEQSFLDVARYPLSTFSVDVDTASYSFFRKQIESGILPPSYSVRIEEMLNYFKYSYPKPEEDHPFSTQMEITDCPWTDGNKLVRIGINAVDIAATERPDSNLVFLIDVSGSMTAEDKLPLLVKGFKEMLNGLTEKDKVAIVAYAGYSGVVQDSISCDEAGKRLLMNKLDGLSSGGSTNGAAGIQKAYEIVQSNFIPGGTNRVLLATDGDFNVGLDDTDHLVKFVKEKAKEKHYLTVLGFGYGNLNDDLMEEISNHADGNYFYIDSFIESKRVLCQKVSGTLVTVAKDVKLQVEFNPAAVQSYRLIGYNNRSLAAEDFNNDRKDAGDIGAGHQVTAIYEIVPAGSDHAKLSVDTLKYQQVAREKTQENVDSSELLTLKVRYKKPEQEKSHLQTFALQNVSIPFDKARDEFRFQISVAAFAQKYHENSLSIEDIQIIEQWNRNLDQLSKDQLEFFVLMKKTRELMQ
ncbi:MAG: von Willebrand factor type A domain-containing protein [Lentisphaeria bacterium]|nr:von Willebrand factor type A domain-containing protein [Lentisphaeria bacterium]